METYSALRQTLNNAGLSENEKKNMFDLLTKQSVASRHDDAYMHCLLRPEDAISSRIPTEYGRHSSTVKQNQTYYINTGTSGEGICAFMPQDLAFKCLAFIGTNVTNLSNANAEVFSDLAFLDDSSTKLDDYFSHARLVSASLKVTFVGETDEESGMLVGGHCYDYNVGLLDGNKVDNSYHVQKVRPSKGLRMIYLPRNDIDFDYTSLDMRLATNNLSTTVAYGNDVKVVTPQNYTWNSNLLSDTFEERTLRVQSRGTSNVSGVPIWVDPPRGEARIPLDLIGTGPRSNLSNNPDRQILAFYWKGLLSSKNSLRIDVVRHFEVVPRVQFREVIGVQRPLHDRLSIDAAKAVGAKTSPVIVSTLENDEQLKQHTERMIIQAPTSNHLVQGIHDLLWVPGWNNPVGDFAKVMNAPQKAIMNALGIDEEQAFKKVIEVGVDYGKPIIGGMFSQALKGLPFV